MYRILQLLTDAEIAECRKIAASAQFVHGRITNPHMKAKQNEQLHEPQAYQKSSQLLLQAFDRSEEFRELRFPGDDRAADDHSLPARHALRRARRCPPSSSFRRGSLRSDLSCTDLPQRTGLYEGGSLHIELGDADMQFKLPPGYAIIYPSDTLHQVDPVTKGERLVAITFIQSRI